MAVLASSLVLLAGASVFYIVALSIHRLFFHRISHIPGPKLAALTYYYQSYYDLWPHFGRFMFQCRELHKIYGPIVRIGPDEIHIDDPDYYNEIYTSSARRRDKSTIWFWLSEKDGAENNNAHMSSFMTLGHDHHRLRRSAMNPFFSKKSVQDLEPQVRDKVDMLKERMLRYAGTSDLLNLLIACSALTLDVISEYGFGEAFGALESPDMAEPFIHLIRDTNKIHPVGRTFPTLLHWVTKIPPWMMPRSGIVKTREDNFGIIASLTQRAWDRVIAEDAQEEKGIPNNVNRNVMRALITSEHLPPIERTIERVGGEGLLLIGAGTETTGRGLAITLYHLLANPKCYDRLLAELRTVIPTPKSPLPKSMVLEQLPYLTAVISEGLRVAHGVGGRLVRIAPDEDLQYGEYTIPRGATFSQSSYIYHTNEKYFPDPYTYNPDRFLGPDGAQAYKNFAPFGKGARSCVGLTLAWMELYLTIAAIISGVKMELVDTTEKDVAIVAECGIGLLSPDSKGIRVRVLGEL